MIETAIELLRDELHAYITTKDASATVIIDNIGMFDTPHGNSLTNNIVLTLVNIEEEMFLKNQPPSNNPVRNSAIYENRPSFLSLYVLCSCNYSGNNYKLALRRLSYIIQFFQSKISFSAVLSEGGNVADLKNAETVNIHFTMQLHPLSFEQVNHLWGSLGGRQMPFALYKLRLKTIKENANVRKTPDIQK